MKRKTILNAILSLSYEIRSKMDLSLWQIDGMIDVSNDFGNRHVLTVHFIIPVKLRLSNFVARLLTTRIVAAIRYF